MGKVSRSQFSHVPAFSLVVAPFIFQYEVEMVRVWFSFSSIRVPETKTGQAKDSQYLIKLTFPSTALRLFLSKIVTQTLEGVAEFKRSAVGATVLNLECMVSSTITVSHEQCHQVEIQGK